MTAQAEILATGPWDPAQIRSTWRTDPWQAPPEMERRADAAIAALSARGSPSHDGLAARLAGWRAASDGLSLELQPVRWALRLIESPEPRSMTALCAVRADDGRWLAGRRAGWLASWPGRWTLGAAGAVEVGEDPTSTLARELEEEWRLVPSRLSVSALVALPSGVVALVGVADVPAAAEPVADSEHDEFAWWPAEIETWPAEADGRLRRMATLLSALDPAA